MSRSEISALGFRDKIKVETEIAKNIQVGMTGEEITGIMGNFDLREHSNPFARRLGDYVFEFNSMYVGSRTVVTSKTFSPIQ